VLLQIQAAMARVSLTANLDRDCKTCIKLELMQVLERPVKRHQRLEKMRTLPIVEHACYWSQNMNVKDCGCNSGAGAPGQAAAAPALAAAGSR